MSLLEISDVSVDYRVGQGTLRAVDSVSLQVEAGEAIGIAGESGCGKSTLGLSVPRLLPRNATIATGQIRLDGEDVTGLTETELNRVRWAKVAFVFQGAMNALNPVHRVSRQILEAIQIHEPGTSGREAERRVAELLDLVGISPTRARSYPHEFSGGMRQRVMIAMALACRPSLLIADEPTTALDVISQAQILSLLGSLRRQQGLALLMISHDLAAIRRTCDRVVVMYAGVVVESGPAALILGPPGRPGGAAHPYTRALIRAHPDLHGERVLAEPLPGHPPDLSQPMSGCRFYDRCPVRQSVCRDVAPEPRQVAGGHVAACHLIGGEMS
ncbi:MAG: ABC transporter ATP-binding protein [Streptosporangiaceae bacterium]